MDIEQLKLVLETLQSVGHDAASLAVLWMWLKFGASVLNVVFWGAVVFAVVFAIIRAIMIGTGAERTDEFLREMRGLLNTGTSGYMTDSERDRTLALLRRLAEEHCTK